MTDVVGAKRASSFDELPTARGEKKTKNSEHVVRQLPVQHTANHAPFIMFTNNEKSKVAVAWFSGPLEGVECRIWLWSDNCDANAAPKPITPLEVDRSHQNPVLDRISDLEWVCYYVSAKRANLVKGRTFFQSGTGELFCVSTSDGGRSWSEPRALQITTGNDHARIKGMWISQPILKESDSKWVLPAYSERGQRCISVFLVSKDSGQTWKAFESKAEMGEGLAQPLIVAGRYEPHVFFRDRKGRRIWSGFAEEDGFDSKHAMRTFWPTEVPNNNSRFSIAWSHRDDCAYLVCNPTCTGEDPVSVKVTRGPKGGVKVDKKERKWKVAQRFPLALYKSHNLVNWSFVRVLHPAQAVKPEPSHNCIHLIHPREVDALEYPLAVCDAQGDLHIVFASARRTQITYLKCSP